MCGQMNPFILKPLLALYSSNLGYKGYIYKYKTFRFPVSVNHHRFSGSIGNGLGWPQRSQGLNLQAPEYVRPNQYIIAYGIQRGSGGKSLPP